MVLDVAAMAAAAVSGVTEPCAPHMRPLAVAAVTADTV